MRQEGKPQADDRKHAHVHRDIDRNMPEIERSDPYGTQHAKSISGVPRDLKCSEQQGDVEPHQHRAADKAKLLPRMGKDKVTLVVGHEAPLHLGPL